MPLRAATLAVALTAAAQAWAQAGGDDEPFTIDADRIEGITELEVSAIGDAEIRRGDLTIFGQTLRYNREFGRIEADGGVRLQSGPDRFSGLRLEYSTVDDTGVFEEPTYLIQRDRIARGSAERLEFLGKNRYRLTRATFTTCVPGQEDWRVEADELELDYEEEEGRASWPRLRFFEATILTAPFAFFPLENRRKSGFLTPSYAQSTARGFEVSLPYYWNIAPERDATLTPSLMARRGLQLKNQVRYLDRRYNGELRLEYMPEDRLFRGSRYGLSLQHAHNFSPALTAQVDYNRVSDHAYLVDLATHVRQVSQTNLPQDAFVNYVGAIGRFGYGLQARVQRFQTLQDPAAPIVPPYHREPQLSFSTGRNDIAGFLDTSLPAEFTRFTHPRLVEGSRYALQPTLAAPRLAPGWFLTPKAGVRHIGYDLTRPAPGQPERPSATIPFFSLDSGLIFERDSPWFGERLTQTLEPRLFYVYVPHVNQAQLPLFDTALADFNYPQLFSENRFSGGDRFGDANHVTAAVTSRFLAPQGVEVFRATVGQRYHFQGERVGLTPGAPVRNFESSDVLASLGGRIFHHVTFDATTQYNPRDNQAERYMVGARYAPEIGKVLNASYRFSRDAIRQLDLSAQWPVRPGWYAVGRYNYSFLDRRLLEGLAGIEYNAGCWVFRGVVQRIRAAAEVSSTAFYLQLEFSGVGQLGTDEAVALLRRNVPGYSVSNPTDLTLAPPSMRPRLPFEQVF
jgi:LPS-assembly protein